MTDSIFSPRNASVGHPPYEAVHIVYYGRWYYDHGSTFLPVWTTFDGQRVYPDQLLDRGLAVTIRPATDAEHDAMCVRFDKLTDDMAYGTGRDHFVIGLGNFETGTIPDTEVAAAVAGIKARARIEPREKRS